MKKSLIIIGSAVLSLGLTACAGDDNASGINNNQGAKIQSNDVRPIVNNNNNNNRSLRISDRAEQQVERLNEVDDAHVIISNNNAYVTVKLTNKNNNTNNDNRTSRINNRNNGNARTLNDGGFVGQGDVRTGSRDYTSNNAGRETVHDVNTRRDANTDANIFGLGNGNIEGNNRMRDNMQNTRGTTNENNRVGHNTQNARGTADRNNYSKVSNAFEQKVADQVRQADNKIHKVYVSVDQGLYNRMNTYADDIRTNRNRDGLWEDFNNTVNNFFGINNNR